ncbi:hypothetical protein RCL_jg24561.t1 [Rhizophagus clarus]|uniref:Uncharacterized protein n=1 Tax=Rhizophagus clarus TaxID=94130 RepID=A0A8H3MK88_9GLOM|nr:hypothetical protein RCL_jg24561.t1 [Rhizophagus clarus]
MKTFMYYPCVTKDIYLFYLKCTTLNIFFMYIYHITMIFKCFILGKTSPRLTWIFLIYYRKLGIEDLNDDSHSLKVLLSFLKYRFHNIKTFET